MLRFKSSWDINKSLLKATHIPKGYGTFFIYQWVNLNIYNFISKLSKSIV